MSISQTRFLAGIGDVVLNICSRLYSFNCFCMSLCLSSAGLDMGPLADGSLAAPPSQAGRRTPRSLPEEPLDGILSPELDKMVTDGQCTRKTFAISFF